MHRVNRSCNYMISLLIFALIFCFLPSCNKDEDCGCDGDGPGDSTLQAQVIVDEPTKESPLSRRVVVLTDQACSLSGKITAEGITGYGLSNPQASEVGTEHEFWFFGLVHDTAFDYQFYPEGQPDFPVAEGSFEVLDLSEELPTLSELVTANSGDGDWFLIYVNSTAPPAIADLIYDRQGRARFFHRTSGHFPQTIGGRIVYTETEKLISLDLTGTRETLFPIDLDQPVLRPSHHKFYVDSLDSETAYVLFNRTGPGVECDGVTPTEKAVGDGIAEIDKNGVELWRWDVFEHLAEIPADSIDPELCGDDFWGPGTLDWTHGNAVTPIPGENAFLISLRNVNRVVKVDRDNSDLVWQIGPGLDFTWLGSEPIEQQWFYRQHDPHWVGDDRLILFDNNLPENGWSRALEMTVDEDAKTVELFWEYRMPDAYAQGNVRRHDNGNTLIGSGTGGYAIEMPPEGIPGDELFVLKVDSAVVRAEYFPPIWIED
jgi:Arylsulfotransferase (ASST)